jgi:hypothetical protein
MKPQNGYILYQGPSELDGEPIVCIATGFAKASQNTKTGAEIQTWILRADLNPYAATQTGADASICGACKHRGTVEPITQNPTQGSARREAPSGEGNPTRNVGRTCYVRITMGGPAAVWRAYRNGAYLEAPWNDDTRSVARPHAPPRIVRRSGCGSGRDLARSRGRGRWPHWLHTPMAHEIRPPDLVHGQRRQRRGIS